MSNLVAVGNAITVKVVNSDNELKEKYGNLIIPEDSKEYLVCDVISVGSKVPDVKAGDKAYIQKGSGFDFTHEDEKYKMIGITDIISIIR